MWRARPRSAPTDQEDIARELEATCFAVLNFALRASTKHAEPLEPTNVEIFNAVDHVAELVKKYVRDGRADRARAELAKGLKP